jgi:hypothetical protein
MVFLTHKSGLLDLRDVNIFILFFQYIKANVASSESVSSNNWDKNKNITNIKILVFK